MRFINICTWTAIQRLADYDTFIIHLLGLVYAAYRRYTDIGWVNGRAFNDDIACVVEIC